MSRPGLFPSVMSRAWLGLTAVVLLAAAGCWGRGFAEVTGTVMVDGKPLQGAFVTFQPEGSDAVRGVGATNAEGRYRVIRPGSKVGAMIGRNRVSVTGGDSGRSLPARYSTESTLEYEVKRGANVFDIDITTK
ncbi:MAG: hypothetical protein ACKO4T_02760 [Planctomycetaceae bacterium]